MPAVLVVEDVDLGAEMPWVVWMGQKARTYNKLRAEALTTSDLPLGEEHIAKYGPGNGDARYYEKRMM